MDPAGNRLLEACEKFREAVHRIADDKRSLFCVDPQDVAAFDEALVGAKGDSAEPCEHLWSAYCVHCGECKYGGTQTG